MAKKVYKPNDYYGYISKIQSKAISNPEWFWSDSADATEARQWLHDNNAGAIIDEIYDNTPESIRARIPYRKLTTNKAQEVYNQGIRDTSNEASKYVAGTLAASAALPYTISAFPTIASEVASTAKFLATPAGKAAASKIFSDMAISTAVGETINESARLSGYNGFGDFASQSVGISPKAKGYKYVSGAADFLNPGYFIGGAATNRLWNATRLGAIESNKLTAEAIERNKMLRDLVNNTKQRLSDSFGNLKSSIVKRVNRIKGGATSAEVPGTVLGPEITPEPPSLNGYPEWIASTVREPDNIMRELPSINTEPSLPNEARRRIVSEATLPESVSTDTSPASVVTEFPEWTTKGPLSGENFWTLHSRGLDERDIENLRQRGYTPEQLGNFRYPSTSELYPTSRANMIASRLNARGVYPEARSRADFTQEAIVNQPVYHAPVNVGDFGIYDVSPGQPITRDEIMGAIRNGILPEDFDFSQLQQATPESINSYYTYFPLRTGGYTIRPLNSDPWLGGPRSVFGDALEAEATDLNRSLSTLSEEEFRTMVPVIKDRIIALRDKILSSGQTPSVEDARSMIKQELTDLYRNQYNKLYKVELPNSTNLWDRVHTQSFDNTPIFDNNDDMLEAIFKDGKAVGDWGRSNPTISATPYTAETVPLEFVTGTDGSYWGMPHSSRNIVGSYSGFSVFGRDREPLERLVETLFGDTTTHGKISYEPNKSMDSTRLFNKQAFKGAKNGKGVILFDGLKDINRTDNKYNYVHTNDLAGTIYNPSIDGLGVLNEVSTKKIADNVRDFAKLLKYTDPRVFKAFGGTPEIKAVIQRPGQSPQYIDLTYSAVKGADNKTNYVFDLFNTDAVGNHTSKAWKILDDFDQEMIGKKNAGESLDGYKFGMLHPLTGFRSFKHGGIIKRR